MVVGLLRRSGSGCVEVCGQGCPRPDAAARLPGVGAMAWTSLLVCLLFPTLAGSASLSSDPIVIRPKTREPARIAVPMFDTDAAVVLKENGFQDVIYYDLELSGYFERGQNQEFIEQTRGLDRKNNRMDFAEWGRLDVMFLLVGTYEIQNGNLVTDAYLYYVPTGKRVFGKRFSNTVDNQRVVAHRIADEIFKYVTGEEGVGNTKILYVSTTDPTRRVREVWVMDADGSNARPVTEDRSLAATPCWGANATEVYYTSYKAFNPDLCGVYLQGGSPWFISQFTGLNVSPAWSARRKRIALTLGRDGNSELYTMSREGKQLKRLTYDRAIDASPCWSPDGSEIVFTSDRTGVGNPQIYIVDAEGLSTPRRISYVESTYCDGAVWSPKGDKIAFSAKVDNRFHVFVCEIDGSNPRQLTFGPHNDEDPTWSPNGLMLAFTSDRAGRSQIFVMNNDGANVRMLSRMGFNTSPAWAPFPTR